MNVASRFHEEAFMAHEHTDPCGPRTIDTAFSRSDARLNLTDGRSWWPSFTHSDGTRCRHKMFDTREEAFAFAEKDACPNCGWDLETALNYIQRHQERVMAAGWCLTLAGGVLNHGLGRDLDIVVYPREAVTAEMLKAFEALFEGGAWSNTPVGRVYSYYVGARLVEFAFQLEGLLPGEEVFRVCPWCGTETELVSPQGDDITLYTCDNETCEEFGSSWEAVGIDLMHDVTARGFRIIEFADRYNEPSSLQKSSLATEAAVWFGSSGRVQKPNPDGPGWVDVALPDDHLVNSRMHLTQRQMQQLLPALLHFARTGELPGKS